MASVSTLSEASRTTRAGADVRYTLAVIRWVVMRSVIGTSTAGTPAQRLAVLLAAGCLASACTGTSPGGESGARLHDPIAVVALWDETRNRGDVAGALALLADDAAVLGYDLDEPGDRAELAEILAAQATAGFRLTDHACTASGTVVTCDYEMSDEALRRWSLALHGVHRYEVVNGRITSANRAHDPSTSDAVYREFNAFRRWVSDRHPDLVEVIWSTPGAAAYTTVLGAQTMLSLLDEYQTATTGGPPRQHPSGSSST